MSRAVYLSLVKPERYIRLW